MCSRGLIVVQDLYECHLTRYRPESSRCRASNSPSLRTRSSSPSARKSSTYQVRPAITSLHICCLRRTKQQNSVWRPIENPVQDYPLAVCDPSSVPDDDLVECDHVRRKFKGATMYAYYNEAHKWYYLGQQRPDEILLLKIFDSDSNVKATSKRCYTFSQHLMSF
jgi:hypothetical protein